MKTLINEKCIEECNSLLKGEIAAVETYQKAIEKYPESKVIEPLIRIQTEHRERR